MIECVSCFKTGIYKCFIEINLIEIFVCIFLSFSFLFVQYCIFFNMQVVLVQSDSVHPKTWVITVIMWKTKVTEWNIVHVFLHVTPTVAIIPVKLD